MTLSPIFSRECISSFNRLGERRGGGSTRSIHPSHGIIDPGWPIPFSTAALISNPFHHARLSPEARACSTSIHTRDVLSPPLHDPTIRPADVGASTTLSIRQPTYYGRMDYVTTKIRNVALHRFARACARPPVPCELRSWVVNCIPHTKV